MKLRPKFFLSLESQLVVLYKDHVDIYANRRPEPEWGVFYLPEFWITLLCGSALLWNLISNFKSARVSSA